ncbi:hypothetical protein D1872_317330 [compost metagenome]
MKMRKTEYSISRLESTAIPVKPYNPASSPPSNSSSLPGNPLKGGMPASASALTKNIQPSSG